MIPIQLTFKGLYSYAKSVTIDFEPLVAARLFGIFGPVGSGKSAILEAIMFVLFDRTTRLNKVGDDRYYNMMNLQTNEMCIDFIFKGGLNNNTKYRFYFLARRNSRDFEKVEVKDRSYYQWTKSDWKPMETSEVLGMTYENFMQTVIIPQGRFRQFIDQKPTARTDMLKELFHLDRFDIAQQAFQMLSTVKEEYHYVEGQLSQFEEINSSLLKKLKKEIDLYQKQIEQHSKTEHSLTTRNNQLQLLQHLHQELVQVAESVQVLEGEAEFFQQKQLQLNRFLKVRDIFKDKISRQQEWLKQAKEKQQQLETVIKQVDEWSRQTTANKRKWQEAQVAYDKKDHLQAQIKDLSLLIQLKEATEFINANIAVHRELQSEIEKMDQTSKVLDEQIATARSAVHKKSELISELQKLTTLYDGVIFFKQRYQQSEALKKEIQQIKNDIHRFKQQRTGLTKQQLDLNKLKSGIAETRERLQHLMVEDDWRQHAGHLEEGKPCPLCGATSHPHPLTQSGLTESINAEKEKLSQLENSLEKQLELAHQLKVISVQTQEKQQQLEKTEQKITEAFKELRDHITKYPKVELAKVNAKKLETEINQVRQKISNCDQQAAQLAAQTKQQQQLQQEKVKVDQKLQKVISSRENSQGKLDQMVKSLQVLDQKSLLSKKSHQLNSLETQLSEKLKKIDHNYKQAFEQLTNSEQQLNQHKGRLKSLQVQVAEIKASSDRLETELLNTCRKESFKGIKEVQNVLALNLNIAQEQKELENYHSELNGLQARRQFLVKKMGKQRYDESEHLQLNSELEALKITIKQLNHQLSSKLATHDQYLIQLKKKDSLAKELEELTLRKNNVQEICNLLRGNGFINFISSVYLQNLVESANIRFIKLTGNSLSLELSENNEFMVRDHLNGGKLRLLKTLSGGQIFQASLSLALSLAENVKKLNEADQSFFFLDEGFGSLDRPSLQLVFETLKSLQKENRIVGVISHVEELQMEIDTFLKVEQHPEKGSIIHHSWQLETTNNR